MFKDNTDLVIPVVNLNGTSRKELIQQVWDASDALFAAIKALKGMAPHGRDYQTADASAYSTAREQHESRVKALHLIKAEVDYISEALHVEYPTVAVKPRGYASQVAKGQR